MPRRLLLGISILFGDIVFRNFVRLYFPLVSVGSVFHPLDDAGFEGISFFEQLVHAFAVGGRVVGKPLRSPD